jgi:hypothetical protein
MHAHMPTAMSATSESSSPDFVLPTSQTVLALGSCIGFIKIICSKFLIPKFWQHQHLRWLCVFAEMQG